MLIIILLLQLNLFAAWPASNDWYPTNPWVDKTVFAKITFLGICSGQSVCYFQVDNINKYLVIPITGDVGKANYAALLSAYNNGKGVKFWALNTDATNLAGLGSGNTVEYLSIQP
jgi:hypothetical protein